MTSTFAGVPTENKCFTAYFVFGGNPMLIVGRVRTVRSGLLIPDFSLHPFELRSFRMVEMDRIERVTARISHDMGPVKEQLCDFFELTTEAEALESWHELSGFMHPRILAALRGAGFGVPPHALLSSSLELRRPDVNATGKFNCGGVCVTSDGVMRLYPRGSLSAFDYHVRAFVRDRVQRSLPQQFELQAHSEDAFSVIVSFSS